MFINYVWFRHGVLWKKCMNQTGSTVAGTIFDNNYNKGNFISNLWLKVLIMAFIHELSD